MVDLSRHILKSHETVEIAPGGQITILNVVTDLPIAVQTEGFDAERLHDLVGYLTERFMRSGAYGRVNVNFEGGNDA